MSTRSFFQLFGYQLILIFFAFSLPVSLVAQSQQNYKPAYLITLASDTLPGFILVKKEIDFSQRIQFKYTLTDSQPQVFEPNQATGFLILGDNPNRPLAEEGNLIIKELLLPVAGNLQPIDYRVSNQLVYTTKKIKITDQEKTQFVRKIISGPVSLYHGFDADQKELYLIQKGASELYPLLEINYLGMLKMLLSECSGLVFDQKESRKNYPLNQQTLTRVIVTYNACAFPAAPTTFNNYLKPSLISWSGGIKGGVGYSKVIYTSSISAEIAQSPSRNNPENYTSKQSFSAGFFTQVNFTRQFSLQTELLFIQKSGSVFKEIYTGTPARYYDYDQRDFKLSYLQLPVLAKYQANLPLKPYLAVGVLMGKELRRDIKVNYYRERESQPRTELPNPKSIHFNASELGGLLAIGCQIPVTVKNNLIIELRYEKTRLPKYSVGVLNVDCLQIQTGLTVF